MTNTTYFLFAGDHYYPAGGMNDFRGTFDSIESAEAATVGAVDEDGYEVTYDWWHIATIVDGQLTIVKNYR